MTREECIEFANALKNNYTIDFDKLPEFCDLVISALEKNESAEEWYKLLCEKWDKGDWVYNFPKGTTNGEALNLVLRKMFPRIIFIRGVDEYHKTKSIVYSEEWENAPYQKGGET